MEDKYCIEQINKIMEHCKDCPYLSISIDRNREIYACAILEDEILAECEEDGGWDYEPDGTEGIFAVARYNHNGEIYDFEWLDDWPRTCIKNKGGDKE